MPELLLYVRGLGLGFALGAIVRLDLRLTDLEGQVRSLEARRWFVPPRLDPSSEPKEHPVAGIEATGGILRGYDCHTGTNYPLNQSVGSVTMTGDDSKGGNLMLRRGP